jgi:hypothetical protein
VAADRAVQDVAKVAFANVLDFARLDADGRVQSFDYDKAREVGAKISVVTRKWVKAKTRGMFGPLRSECQINTSVDQVGKYLGLFPIRRKRK